MIKAIILDCFGVLCIPVGEDFYKSHIPNYKDKRDQLRDLDYAADMGKITQNELIKTIATLGNMREDEVRRSITGNYVRNQKLLEFSQNLRPSIKVGFLSNINAQSAEQFFTSAERAQFFDAAVISGDVGLAKPDPLIFEMVAQKIGVTPAECVMVDDNSTYCDGAKQAGMQAIVFESTNGAIAKLKELL